MMTTTMKMMKKMVSLISAAVMAGTMAINAAGTAFAGEGVSNAELREKINEVAKLVNEAREEAGLKPLYVLPYLNEISETRAEEISVEFSHQTLRGAKFSSLIDTSIVDYYFTAENIAAGSDNAEDTFEQWRNSPSHWKAIMTPELTHMGIGVYYDEDSDYGWYWQQLFVDTDQEFEDQYLPSDKDIVPQAEGDITGDGIVDSYDYLSLADYIYKKKNNIPVYLNEAQLATADCFRDGIITEADAKVMVRYLLGEYKSLPFVF